MSEFKRNKDQILFVVKDDAEHGHTHTRSHLLLVWVNAVVMSGMALLFTWLLASGNIRNYINTEFVFYTYIGAGILLLLAAHAVGVAAGQFRQSHGLHMGVVAAGVLAVPLLFGMVVPSRPLGLDSVTDDIDAADIVGRTGVSNNSISQTESWNILDWLAAYYSIDDFQQLDARPADVTGFVRSVPGDGENFFRVTRFMVTCCVADTISVDMPVQYEGDDVLVDGQWVKVTGTVTIGEFSGDTKPYIQAESLELLDAAPSPSYLYP